MDIGAGGIGFAAVDNVEDLMLDKEDPGHVGPVARGVDYMSAQW